MAANALVGIDLTTVIPCFSALNICKPQCFQNSLVRIVTSTKYSHITLVRKTFHWSPHFKSDVKPQINIFETALVVYKFLHSGYPKYLYISLKLDTVFITYIKAKLMVCSLRSHTFHFSV